MAILLSLATGCTTLAPKPTPPVAADISTLLASAEQAYRSQDWTAAQGYYEQVVHQDISQTESWFRLGNIYARTGQLPQSAQAFQTVLAQDSEHTRAMHNLGIVQLRQAELTFARLEAAVPVDDPLHQRSASLRQAITDMLEPE
ncbi:MAG: tetratricopeptide repeat protein [Gammaproteobacteria bacterium]|nr:tetratricopeptide repeat protein [Gammaproteobacteria bacterium]